MPAGDNRNLGPRLVVIMIALGIVILGLQPIRKNYGGARGLLRKAFPSGFDLNMPSVEGIRESLISLEKEHHRGNTGETTRQEVKVAPGPAGGERPGPSLMTRISRFFSSRDSGKPAGNAADKAVARNRTRDKTERARLSGAAKEGPERPNNIDRLSQEDREELNKLLDGF